MAEKKKYLCSASVTLTVRVTGRSYWGEGATVAEVQEKGSAEIISAVRTALSNTHHRHTIVGDPVVGAITWEPSHD